jgi:hypothetical protein
MQTPEADAIAFAITARTTDADAEMIDLRDVDMDFLTRRLARHLTGKTPADAIAEALAVGFVAGRRQASLSANCRLHADGHVDAQARRAT